MKSKSQLTLLALIASASVIVGMVLAGGLNLTIPGQAAAGDGASDQPLHAAAREQMAARQGAPSVVPASFADVASRVNPAVVSIESREVVKSRRPTPRRPRPDDPFEFFFGPNPWHFRPPQQEGEPDVERSGGSGFLISDDGYILTNYHVIEGAERIKVELSGDRREYVAEVVGTDPATDLALIKIKADARLPYLKFGDSDEMRVGDWVVAVGNPLNWDHTVTVGVVSAKGRQLGPELSKDFSLDNFIQTDAAINFGNSGGPLVNLAGDVVGVNTAISSVGQGIGFAVPINVARDVLDQLKTKGKVSRGYLGIYLDDVNPDLQEAFGLKSDKGAFVMRVVPGKPGDAAGVKKGDVIVAVDGRAVGNTKEVVRLISAKEPGSSVRLTLMRDGKELTVSAKLEERPVQGEEEESEETGGPAEDPNEKMLGIGIDTLTPETAERLELPRDTRGVLVRRVSRLSQAFERGVGEGDVITEVNRVPVGNVADFRREIKKVKPGGLVVFYVISPSVRTRGDAVSRYVTVRLQESE